MATKPAQGAAGRKDFDFFIVASIWTNVQHMFQVLANTLAKIVFVCSFVWHVFCLYHFVAISQFHFFLLRIHGVLSCLDAFHSFWLFPLLHVHLKFSDVAWLDTMLNNLYMEKQNIKQHHFSDYSYCSIRFFYIHFFASLNVLLRRKSERYGKAGDTHFLCRPHVCLIEESKNLCSYPRVNYAFIFLLLSSSGRVVI